MDARKWLRANRYDDLANLIDEIINEWKASGNGTRRNWWDKLAGRKGGQPCIVAGREIPVLRAAQVRQGKEVTPNALCKNVNETIPGKVTQQRWEKRKT